MNWIDNIYNFNAEEKFLIELKNSTIPLIIFGEGEIAERVCHKLILNSIKVDAFMVLHPTSNTLHNSKFSSTIPYVEAKDISEKYPEFNLVAGILDYKRIPRLVDSFPTIKKIYYFSNLFEVPEPISYEYIKQHSYEFEYLFNLLQDDESKKSYIAYLNTKVTGDPKYIMSCVKKHMYFGYDFLPLSSQEIMIDCGAYNGDTLVDFLKYSHESYKYVYALEPDEKNYNDLCDFISSNDFGNIIAVKKGSYNCTTVLHFSSNEEFASKLSEDGESMVEVDKIDNIVNLNNGPITLIKMDVQGAELASLQGAKETILRDKPRLAICAYHKADDLIELPKYILSLVPEYKFYFRTHKCMGIDAVLYAIPKE